MKFELLDLLVLATYMLAMTIMGIYFARKNRSTEDYFLGGRRYAGWTIGLSMVGTAISSITFLSMPADAFKTSWLRFIPYGAMPFCVVIAMVFVVPIFRRRNITSAYEFLESRFGPSVRVYGSSMYILAQLLRISLVLYLVSLLLHEITGLDEATCIIISGVFVGVYTIIGGIDAVIWTDVIQTVILGLGSIICIIVIINALPGGFSQIIDVANAHQKLSFASYVDGSLIPIGWQFDLGSKTGTMMLITGVTFFLTEYVTGQHMIQRYCAAKSLLEARKGLLYAIVISIPTWTFYMFLGTALFVFFQEFPQPEVSQMLSGEKKAEQIVPYFVLNYLPSGFVGLVVAAALAAGMSSLDSSINAISTVGVVDVYRRHMVKDKDDKHYLLVAKVMACIASVVMITGALSLLTFDTKTLQDTAIILTSLASGGILGLFLLGMMTQKGDGRAVWCGITATLIFTLWTILQQKGLIPESLSAPFDLYYTSTLANFVLFLVGYLFGLVLPASENQQQELKSLG